jgi:KUP system potassium uptake protein
MADAASTAPGTCGPPPEPPSPDPHAAHMRKAGLGVALAALGVVFGDIGTSPLYAMATIFHVDGGRVPVDQDAIYGVLSLIVWAVTIIVSLKYLTCIMRADNDGEGGIMALIALIQRVGLRSRQAKWALVSLGIFGAALFYGDGMITPAISVLSAVEGLEVPAPSLHSVVVPIALVILVVLFLIQRFGTGAVGRLFGPVMALWFVLLALAGLREIVHHPDILRALSPTYAVAFLFEHGGTAFVALGSIVLAVTGAEALYADMGHFGASPIRRSWFVAVFPALTLNYLGQGALIVRDPKAIDNPFFLLLPAWSRIPMVVLATLATVIASQAVISGAFSVTRQAINLGFLPRITVRHTSDEEAGQVYVPAVNWGICVAVIALVIGFGSSTHLASAYGIAVTGTLAIDTILFFVVVRVLWGKPLWIVVAGAAGFLLVDLAFFSANLTKVLHGGWFPLLIAVCVFVVLTTWRRGSDILVANRLADDGPLDDFIEELRTADPPIYRAPGTGVFLSSMRATTPLALSANVDHNHVLHRNVVIIRIDTANVPHVPPEEQVEVDDLGYRDDGISHVTAHLGFQDRKDVPRLLRLAIDHGLEGDCDPDDATYLLSRMNIIQTGEPGMAGWRKRLFLSIARSTANPVEYFHLPVEQTIVMQSNVKL